MRKADWNPLTPLSGCCVVWRHTGQVIKPVLVSLDLHGEVGKAVVTERVETGQCPGLSVAIQTDWTGQLMLKILESLTSCRCFLCGH